MAAAQAAQGDGMDAGDVLGGAANGAAIGTSIAPGWGSLIGGAVGAVGGALQGEFGQQEPLGQVGQAMQGQGPVGQIATSLLKKKFQPTD